MTKKMRRPDIQVGEEVIGSRDADGTAGCEIRMDCDHAQNRYRAQSVEQGKARMPRWRCDRIRNGRTSSSRHAGHASRRAPRS